MSDRELLEKAAKAAGYSGIIGFGGDVGVMAPCNPAGTSKFQAWNPLINDGDALRLAVKLRLTVVIREDDIRVNPRLSDDKKREFYGNDPYAATRRAIVRAAAALAGDREQS